ncbi:Mif2/CENP-C like-domain-containing protein [Hygrophoropsis aurantiaca]|uniref:Mif2/CENP-C like-domain-containing protein n=1 Tax=Hygrophoropsis aurantiaca TaxID=72124 RepID=A0ACB8AM73_9AGAM|nr:Mif2/CENP-C like-domain-containing protein [Hygrophoropsis aurantiaca]
MPRESTQGRKSSVGTRRGPPKRHIPYRGDDLGLGKKTGIAVGYVDRNSDEFEPFDELMKQADNRTPPRVNSRKKRKSVAITPVREEQYFDEDGEMSMVLAESNQGSPLEYFTNAPSLYSPNRKLGSSRSVNRSSHIDYDEVPSPRPRASAFAHRRSLANGAGPSSLSKSFFARDHDPEPEPDVEVMDEEFEDYNYPEPDSPRQTSFTQVDQGEQIADEEDEYDPAGVEVETAVNTSKSDKGKRRADLVEEYDDGPEQGYDGMEDDIAQGLEGVENGPEEEDEAEEPPAKKSKAEEKVKKPPKPRKQKTVRIAPERSPTPDGVRRSRRHRFKPLEYWRQEKVVYGRSGGGVTLVPHIKEIIRIPQEPAEPLGKHHRKRKRSAPPRSKSRQIENPEEGWDDETPTTGVVINFHSQEEVTRRVTFTAKSVQPKQAGNHDWRFQKVFGEGTFIAAGQLNIPPKSMKPSKSTKDNTYVFYVIEGAVSVVIHKTPFIITTGGMFLVPRGNTYHIQNISDRDAKIFFTQARQTPPDDEVPLDHDGQSEPLSSRFRRASTGSAAPQSVGPRGSSTSARQRANSTKS